jgi:hypothetical protein
MFKVRKEQKEAFAAAADAGELDAALDPCPKNIPVLWLHVDADRDGTVDDDTSGLGSWTYGRGMKGAILLCNNDDDDRSKGRDSSDDVVNGSDDLADLSPLVIRRAPPDLSFPSGYKAFLRVSEPTKIRIFDGDGASAKEILGPTSGKSSYEIPDLGPSELRYCMEAASYPTGTFPGEVDITLEVRDPKGRTHCWRMAKVRVAPWIMPTHMDPTERVFVMDAGDWNKTMRKQLRDAAASAGATLCEIDEMKYTQDIWMQDVMEMGYSSLPRKGVAPGPRFHLPVVLRTAADRLRKDRPGDTADDYPEKELLGPDLGFHQTQTPTLFRSSLDSFGNLECSPPVEVAGKPYPFGRVVFGYDVTRPMQASVKFFLAAQHVQAPFAIDTSWLTVGHVDEVISFCPFPKAPEPTPKFRVLVASPKVAMEILRDLQQKGFGDAPMFQDIEIPKDGELESDVYKWTTPDAILGEDELVAVQDRVQGKIDAVERHLLQELGLREEYLVRIPVLFRAIKKNGVIRHLAYTPNSVNMLVVTRADQSAVLCIPKPFGPVVGGKCQLEAKIDELLAPFGHDLVYVDDFITYHQNFGEVHCGTNSQRKPRTDLWWWEVDPT